jgi:hypothetical protein
MFNLDFWFQQPGVTLGVEDKILFIVFAGMIVLGAIFILWTHFNKHQVVKKLLGRVRNLFVWVGLVGVLWFVMRYENVPMLGKRFWFLVFALWWVIWAGFIAWYGFTRFRKDKKDVDWKKLNSKYLPDNYIK